MTPRSVPPGESVRPVSSLFVYGTLRRGQRNHHWLQQSTMLGTCETSALFRLVDAGGFPGAVIGGNQSVVGEVYRIEATTFSRLDELEGYPEFFDRVKIDTVFGSCWIYLYARANGMEPVINSGDWLRG